MKIRFVADSSIAPPAYLEIHFYFLQPYSLAAPNPSALKRYRSKVADESQSSSLGMKW